MLTHPSTQTWLRFNSCTTLLDSGSFSEKIIVKQWMWNMFLWGHAYQLKPLNHGIIPLNNGGEIWWNLQNGHVNFSKMNGGISVFGGTKLNDHKDPLFIVIINQGFPSRVFQGQGSSPKSIRKKPARQIQKNLLKNIIWYSCYESSKTRKCNTFLVWVSLFMCLSWL